MPLPAGQKWPPPDDHTGEFGIVPTRQEVEDWTREMAGGNVALRLVDCLGIDVDHYDKIGRDGTVEEKRGGDTLAEWEEHLGPLPATLVSSARLPGDVVSGIRVYRLPRGVSSAGWAGGAAGIELIKQSHRYVVAAPSTNPDAGGAMYQWFNQETHEITSRPPRVADLAELPMAWGRFFANLKAARGVKKTRGGARTGAGDSVAEEAPSGEEMCRVVRDRLADVLAALGRKGGGGASRHDTVLRETLALIRFREQGHTGVPTALSALKDVFIRRVGADRAGGEAETDGEFDRMVREGAEIVANDPSESGECNCSYLTLAGDGAAVLDADAEAVIQARTDLVYARRKRRTSGPRRSRSSTTASGYCRSAGSAPTAMATSSC